MYGIHAIGRRLICNSLTRSTNIIGATMSSSSEFNFKTLAVSSPSDFVYHVEINRPDKLNAMNKDFWKSGFWTRD